VAGGPTKNMEEDKSEKIKGALDESSKHNSRLMLSFLAFELYIAITVILTSDVQLLIPGSNAKLPIINVEIPLFGFFIVAPLLIVIFHFNLLFNLVQHYKKLDEWVKSTDSKDKLLLPPYIFNFVILFKERSINYYIFKFIIWSIYLSPLLILFYIQRRFSSYHNLYMTLIHLILIMADAFLIFLYWYRIVHPDLLDTKYDSFKNIRSYHSEKGLLSLRHSRSIISTLVFWIIILFSVLNLLILILLPRVDAKYLTKVKPIKLFIPYIEIREKMLVESRPSDEIIQRYLALGKSEDDAWCDFAKGLNLQGRDLRFAILDASTLINANLREAQLQNASMWGVDLRGANMGGAKMQKAQLHFEKLDGAFLGGAQIEDAFLSLASLCGADLGAAKLKGSYLNGTDLTAANLGGADLRGTQLWDSSLIGANLNNAKLEGADFMRSTLICADLSNSSLEGANFLLSKLEGANFSSARLGGTNLENAEIFCADLSGAILNGIFFNHIDKKTHINFDKVIELLESKLPNKAVSFTFNPQKEFVQRIKMAAKKCRNIKQSSFSSPLYSTPDKFINIRKQLACEDSKIAYRILDQNISNDITTKKFKDNILYHINSKCSKILTEFKNK